MPNSNNTDKASIVIKIHNSAKNQQERKNLELFSVDISGRLEIYSNNYSCQPPFNHSSKCLELRSQLNYIGFALPENSEDFRASNLRLSTLQDDGALE